MNILNFTSSVVLEILVPLVVVFVGLCVVSAIFMVTYNKVSLLYNKEREKMDFWTSMAAVVFLFIVGALLFKPQTYSFTKPFNY